MPQKPHRKTIALKFISAALKTPICHNKKTKNRHIIEDILRNILALNFIPQEPCRDTPDGINSLRHNAAKDLFILIWLRQYTACHQHRFPIYYFKNPVQSPCYFPGINIQNILNILKDCPKKRASILGKASPKETSWRFCPWFPSVGTKTAKGHNRSWHTACARHGRDDCLCFRKATPSLTFRGYYCDA